MVTHPVPFASKITGNRASAETLFRQKEQFSTFDAGIRMMDAVPNGVVVLNTQRQIVYANQAFLDTVGLDHMDEIIGQRTGEALGCIRSSLNEGGCGTSEFCTTCGALHAILQSQSGHNAVRECRIMLEEGGQIDALDLRVWTTPTTIDGEPFTIFAIADIGDEKRREVLERVFFHDIRNTAGIIVGVVEMIKAIGLVDAGPEVTDLLAQSSSRLVEEIEAQQYLVAAERGDLVVERIPLSSTRMLQGIVDMYSRQSATKTVEVVLDAAAEKFVFITDQALVGRVIGNMVKNAVEASRPGDTVTVGCEKLGDDGIFWVHNPTHMPRNVQLQIFNRSFSTKGSGRGLGTYSMKLLSERFLQGRVSFTSSEEAGTRFVATYPLENWD